MGFHAVYWEITIKVTPSCYFHLLYHMCNSKGFLLFNRKVTIGPTTLHTKCCPGAEGRLANSFTNIWKAIGINLVDGGKKHNDHGSQDKVLPFLLTAGIRNASTGRSLLWEKGDWNKRTGKGKEKGKWGKFPDLCSWLHLQRKNWVCPRQSWAASQTPLLPLTPSLSFYQDKDLLRLLGGKKSQNTRFCFK